MKIINTQFVLVVAIVITANLIASELNFRLDFTADKRYTLSDATLDILNNLDDVVTISAYFSGDLPTQLLTNEQELKDLLQEYVSHAEGNLVYKFINPNLNNETEKEAQVKGVAPVMVNIQERDQMKQIRVYMGVVIQVGEASQTIPLIQPGSSLEYELTTAIKRLSTVDKPKVGFVKSFGCSPMEECAQLREQLSVLYEPININLNDSLNIDDDIRTIAIIDPSFNITSFAQKKLDRFLQKGGSIFFAGTNMQGNIESMFVALNDQTNWNEWLKGKGVQYENKIVVDVQCSQVQIQQQEGPFIMNVPVQFPYYPIISNFNEHPIGGGIEALQLSLVTPLSLEEDAKGKASVFAETSEKSGTLNVPLQMDIEKQWDINAFNQSKIPIGVAVEGPLGSSGKLAVISNGDFIVNGSATEEQRQLGADNVSLAANTIDWLSDDTGLIELRTKGITARMLEPTSNAKRVLIKYANVILPIALILIYGFYRRQLNARKRRNWLEGKF